MLSKEQKKTFRARLFKHLDGLVTAPCAFVLHKQGICDYILEKQSTSLSEIADSFTANTGYLHVALRVLCSQGWLDYSREGNEIKFSTNKKTADAFDLFQYYRDVNELLEVSGQHHNRLFEMEPFQKLHKMFITFNERYKMPEASDDLTKALQEQILSHIEGHLIGPTVVHLGMGGMFHKYFMEASFTADEYHRHPESFEIILDFLTDLGWFVKKAKHYTFTDKGLFFAKRASAYGVTVSYLPMFRKIEELIFGDGAYFFKINSISKEHHVDREMNVWGSGGAHAAYFKKVDEIVKAIFNKPIEEQPKGIVDMGCGNGAFLIHLFEVIEQQTLRGQHLEDYPLFLVGADFNEAALKVTRSNLIQADIWAKVIWGDIGDPNGLQADLKDNYNIDLEDLLSVRTFLDHNRPWFEPQSKILEESNSNGAFATRGKFLHPNDVERNLKDHFNKWRPFIQKHGLILIELHSINPELTATNIGRTAATAYDATHGFSDQYILEIDSFLKVLEELGLNSQSEYFSRFPDSELATVSINFINGDTQKHTA